MKNTKLLFLLPKCANSLLTLSNKSLASASRTCNKSSPKSRSPYYPALPLALLPLLAISSYRVPKSQPWGQCLTTMGPRGSYPSPSTERVTLSIRVTVSCPWSSQRLGLRWVIVRPVWRHLSSLRGINRGLRVQLVSRRLCWYNKITMTRQMK
jgi:hypothetical protein